MTRPDSHRFVKVLRSPGGVETDVALDVLDKSLGCGNKRILTKYPPSSCREGVKKKRKKRNFPPFVIYPLPRQKVDIFIYFFSSFLYVSAHYKHILEKTISLEKLKTLSFFY